MNDDLEKLGQLPINNLESEKFDKQLEILKNFLDEETIEFIIENNPFFINKVSINSLLKSSNIYSNMNDFDYQSLIKWLPILIDYDRTMVILKYLKNKNIEDDKIARILEISVEQDFLLADSIIENDKQNYNDIDFKRTLNNLKIAVDNSKVHNETFNNLINKSINKYDKLLRKLE